MCDDRMTPVRPQAERGLNGLWMDVVCPLVNSMYPVFSEYGNELRESPFVAYYEPPSGGLVEVCGVRYPLRFQKSNPVVFRRCEAFWISVPSGGDFDTVHVVPLYAIRDQRR